jgi:flagellar basal-body rod protein FlgF
MNVSLYQSAAAMNANARWQDMVSENLASSSIPGARGRNISFSSVQANSQFVIPAANTSINFQPGELRSTGNPLDFALEGKGFFEVQLPNGEHAFTRDGEFHLSAQGQLVTKQGYTVLGDGGPLQMDPSNAHALAISATGEVSQGGDVKGKLKLAEFDNPQLLTVLGSGMFRADNPNLQPSIAPSTQVRQGFIEASNISTTSQMVSLITAMRAFEANQKVIQMQDDRMGRTITDLGTPT